MYKKLLYYDIFSGTKDELLEEILKRDRVNIVSGNPEVLYNGLKNSNLKDEFTKEDALIIPDGVGTVIASKLYKNPIGEKIAGIETMDMIVNYCNLNGKKIYLLGSTKEVVEGCKNKLKDKYKDLKIAGYHDGFFDMDNCDDLIEDIKKNEPFALFVAMGSPRQEKFIKMIKDKVSCKIFMAVGGSFDVISGNLKRAPKWMISLGLEWLYRVCKEPFRIKRLGVIPKFIFIVWKDKNNKEKFEKLIKS